MFGFHFSLNKNKKRLLAVCIILLAALSSHGQVKNIGVPLIRNFNQNSIDKITQTWSIMQGSNGIMYLGNSYGISEYDGAAWRWMRIKNNSSIYSLKEIDNKIFVGAIDELGFINPAANGYLEYTSLTDLIPKIHRKFDVVSSIFRFRDYVIFQADYKLFFFRNEKIQVVSFENKIQRTVVLNGKLYLYISGKGLLQFDETNFSLHEVSTTNKSLNLAGIDLWGNSNLLLIDYNKGAFLFSENEIKPFHAGFSDFILKYKPFSLLHLKNGYYAFGTVLNGILITDKDGKPVQHIDREKGLANNKILCLSEDAFGNIWAGHDDGTSYIEINSPFTYIPKQYVAGTGTYAIVFKENLYLATSEGLFKANWKDMYDPFSGAETFSLVKNTEGQVWSLSEQNQSLIIGQYNGSSVLIGTKTDKIFSKTGTWKVLEITGKPEYLLQGTYEGFILLKKAGLTWNFYRQVKGFTESSRIFEMDINGDIWVTHGYKGVFRIRLNNNLDSANVLGFYGKKDGFPSNLGINVFKVKNKILFTSEYGGIYTFNKEKNVFEAYHEFDKYLGKKPAISKLYEDKGSNIWFVNLDKVGVLQYQPNHSYRMLTQPFNALSKVLVRGFESIYPIDSTNILFGSKNGFIHYNPLVSKDYTIPFNTHIRNVELVNFKDSSIFGGYRTGNNSSPELKYSENSVRFTYATTFFEQDGKVSYKYYLEGFDDNWVQSDNFNSKEYLKLPGGYYTFHVKAINIYGKEGNEDTFSFYVHPHFTKTWWAYGTYFILIVLLIALILYVITRNREKKFMRIKMVQEKEIIELKNQRLMGDVENKNSELSSLTLQVVKKNDVLNGIKQRLGEIQDKAGSNVKHDITSLLRMLENETSEENDWEEIELYFNNVYKGFLKKLKEHFPELRSTELKLCAYIRMDLSNKEIATLMNNTTRGIEAYRYRLRKSLGLKHEENLKEFLFNFE